MKKLVKKLIRWSVNTKILSLPRGIFGRIVLYAIQSKGGRIVSYSEPKGSKAIDLIDKIREERLLLQGSDEAYQIFMAVERTEKIKGDLAEVGVYKGGSAKLICEAKGDRPLHLFDIFEEIPKEDVGNYLKEYKNVYFYQGLFPTTAEPIKNNKFSFVHFDVDTYESTLSCLEFFHPRMNRGGIIISHDYICYAGVRKAFDGFFEDKTEPVIEMSGSQCLVVKL